MGDGGEARILVVVPTLGRRLSFLRQNLQSIRDQELPADVVIVRPAGSPLVDELASEFGAEVLDDCGSLPGAINMGMQAHGAGHDFVTWLGDDDLLEKGSFARVVNALDLRPDAVAAFGYCRYIDDEGRSLWVSRAGRLAPLVLPWGPDLVPQPGMLFRTHAWMLVGGLDESYRFAFDLDLLLRLKNVGRLAAVPEVVAAFRWHGDSLTVSDRTANLVESERAKRAQLSSALRFLAPVWEVPVRWQTRLAANRLTQRARS